MSHLEVVADGRRYLLDETVTAICGRSADAHVHLTDRRVGRLHARLCYLDDAWHLIDEKSTNGTFIDGERVQRCRIDSEVTAYLGNPKNGALLFLRPYVTADVIAKKPVASAPYVGSQSLPSASPAGVRLPSPSALAPPSSSSSPSASSPPSSGSDRPESHGGAAAEASDAIASPDPFSLVTARSPADALSLADPQGRPGSTRPLDPTGAMAIIPPASAAAAAVTGAPAVATPRHARQPDDEATEVHHVGAADGRSTGRPAVQDPPGWEPPVAEPGDGPRPSRPSPNHPAPSQPTGSQPVRSQPTDGRSEQSQPVHGLLPGQFPSTAPPPAGQVASAPVLVIRLGVRTLIFPLGQPIRVGRDGKLEAVTDHPLVTRNYHGVITTDAGGATYTDSSSRGTYHQGRLLKAPLRITEPVTLRLGDPATGEELGITPPLSLIRLNANRRRRERSTRLKVAAAVIALVLVAAGAVVTLIAHARHTSPVASASPVALSAATLEHAETATVRLLVGTANSNTGWGSGTVISPDGLILTNAHVAAPRTPGAAVATAAPGASLGRNPDFLTVQFTTGDAAAVQARYRARTVAVDGYLDLAVVRIFADADGDPINPSTLNLPYLKLGDVKALRLDQAITILGYPGVSGSDSITVTSGVISTFVPDPLRHVDDPRFQLETTARVAHGNSGGAAITNTGELVGVPSLSIPGQGSDLSWRLRSVAEAAPLIAAARNGTEYRSTLLIALTGHERVVRAGIGDTPQTACIGAQTIAGERVVIAFTVTGLTRGLDIAFLIEMPDGTAVTTDVLQDQSIPGLPEITATEPQGCLTYTIAAADLGLKRMPAGAYHAQLLAGPNLDPLAPVVVLTVD